MTEPLADRLLETLGDPVAREVVRSLLLRECSQNELVGELGVAQATASRAIRVLRAVGLVSTTTGRRNEKLRIEADDAVIASLLAIDRLAEKLLEAQTTAQLKRSAATRRLAIRPAEDSPKADTEPV